MSFQCLGSWPGENHGETYMSLLDTKLPQLGEEARPRYRCAVSPPNFTFPFFSKPACSAELNEHLVCCFQKRQSNGVAKKDFGKSADSKSAFTPALKARLPRLKNQKLCRTLCIPSIIWDQLFISKNNKEIPENLDFSLGLSHGGVQSHEGGAEKSIKGRTLCLIKTSDMWNLPRLTGLRRQLAHA